VQRTPVNIIILPNIYNFYDNTNYTNFFELHEYLYRERNILFKNKKAVVSLSLGNNSYWSFFLLITN
jgi:hypothetical protein